MRRFALACRLKIALVSCAMIFVLLANYPARSEETPQAIVARGVQAVGGEANLLRARAAQAKIKGTFHDPAMKGSILEGAKFTGDVITQLPAKVKISLFLETAAGRQSLIQVLNGNKSWTRDREVSQQDDAATTAEFKESAYLEYVATLVPLLKDKAYTLSSAGEAQVQQRPAVGINVSSKGHSDVTLYFDKSSGFLIKTRQRRRDRSTNKEVLHEELLSDYQEVNPLGKQEEVLRTAHIGTDDPALLGFLRKQTLSEDARKKIQDLIGDLGNASFQSRQKAKEALIAQGVTALPALKQAVHNPDPEIAGSAKECLKAIGKTPDPAATLAAIRILAVRKPAGATEALRNYLPSAPDEAVAQEVRAALGRDAAGQRLFLPGLKRPMRGETYENEKKTREYELSDFQFVNRLDDSVFSQP